MTSDDRVFCRVDRDNRIVEAGGGEWDRFALENDGRDAVAARVLGTNLLDHVHGDASRMLVFTMLERARRITRPHKVPFRCDSPHFKRFMEMEVSPAPNQGVSFAYRLLRVEPFPEPLRFAVGDARRGPLRIRCSSCNRIREAGRWREPEETMTGPEPIIIAYGVCDICQRRVRRLTTSPSLARSGASR